MRARFFASIAVTGLVVAALATAFCTACGGSVTAEITQDASSGEAGGEAGADAGGDAVVDASPFQHLCLKFPLPTGCDHVVFEREGDVGQCLMGCHSCSCSGSGWSCTQGSCQVDAGACPADEPQSRDFCAQSIGTKCDYPMGPSGCGHDECTCDSSQRWGCAAIGCAEAGVGD